jgi:hypothetical protein
VDGLGGEARDSLRKECRLSRSSVSSPSVSITQTCMRKAVDGTSLQGIYKLSHSVVIVWIKVQMCSQSQDSQNLPFSTLYTHACQHHVKWPSCDWFLPQHMQSCDSRLCWHLFLNPVAGTMDHQ